jgi:hypothetical protein
MYCGKSGLEMWEEYVIIFVVQIVIFWSENLKGGNNTQQYMGR